MIYTTHFSLAPVFITGYFLPTNLNTFPLILLAASASIIIILGCFGIFKIVQLSPLLNLFLYGHEVKDAYASRVKDAQTADGKNDEPDLQSEPHGKEKPIQGVPHRDREMAVLMAEVPAYQQERLF